MRSTPLLFLAACLIAGCDAIRGDADFEAKRIGSSFDTIGFRGDATAVADPAANGRQYTITLQDPDDLLIQMVYDSDDPFQGCTYYFRAREPARTNPTDRAVSGRVETGPGVFNLGPDPDTTVYDVSLEVQYRSDTVIEGRLRVNGYLDQGRRPDRGDPEGNPRFEIIGRFKARGENLMPDISDTIRPCP
ncbi:hypothetical protein [Rubricoccus marinus]|uniref:Lipoprotein n=1 Tax=Rubricoccus marinus TaxID=716817 RepID=A0A259TY12_9BACT|nr:hypothetical protein [Rubricoccus marinus]OZC02639.1 hypothetical protein BSZ36_06410 [Rubricoccus marinus]